MLRHVQGSTYPMLSQRFGYPFSVRKIGTRSTNCHNYLAVGIAPPYGWFTKWRKTLLCVNSRNVQINFITKKKSGGGVSMTRRKNAMQGNARIGSDSILASCSVDAKTTQRNALFNVVLWIDHYLMSKREQTSTISRCKQIQIFCISFWRLETRTNWLRCRSR